MEVCGRRGEAGSGGERRIGAKGTALGVTFQDGYLRTGSLRLLRACGNAATNS